MFENITIVTIIGPNDQNVNIFITYILLSTIRIFLVDFCVFVVMGQKNIRVLAHPNIQDLKHNVCFLCRWPHLNSFCFPLL